MSAFLDSMISRAKARKQTIVLPEGNDPRTLEAAEKALASGIANLIILGDPEDIAASSFNLGGAQVINPATSELKESFAEQLAELRKKKGMTYDMALGLVEDVLYFGVMMVKTGCADGMVAGACHATGDVLRPCLQILKCAPGVKLVSSFFVMVVPDCEFGENGTFIFSDCGLEVQPSAENLAHIAVNSAKSWETIMGTTPKVALLSHSSHGSAKNDDANKVIEATAEAHRLAPTLLLDGELQLDAAIKVALLSHSSHGSAKNDDANKVIEATAEAHRLAPTLLLDGELQLDAAIVPSVGQSKAPGSSVAGQANILVFPDLDAGNIGYKLVQRLAKAEAYGPITQGIAAPVNDLSRGCSADDIVGVIAITCVQAQAKL